ncbi:glutamate formimidoyltransferase [Carnobacterium sp. TMP28]|uniref:glutamate formimidoyltransferase n=1 Tax=Carnobacterium sp. TMP28 TaxID=3397060 RepID=UPI0039DF5DB8
MSKKHVLCVPNFSDGKNMEGINAAVEAVKNVPTVKIVAVEPEANFNRTVLTYICDPEYCEESMLKLAEQLYKFINMETQKGDHPRIGALDTMPVFPLGEMTVEETTELAEKLGQSLHDHFGVPVYFSGQNARTEYKKSNTNIRRGQYEGLKAILEDKENEKYDERKPDLSVNGELDAKMGACTVSSDLEGLTAYNVYVESEDVSISKKIAKRVKSAEHGWASIKSVGFKDEGHPGTAVSMNVFDASETPLAMLSEWVNVEAEKDGTKVISTGLVGPVKLKYIAEAAQHYGHEFDGKDYDGMIKVLEDKMGLEGFKKESIIEYHLD